MLMRCNHCGKCCEETEMELSNKDIEQLEEMGYVQEEFTVIDEDGQTRLKNLGKWCYFYDATKKRCRVYAKRPTGCYIYPVVYSVNRGIIIDKLCPRGKTISERELKRKGRKLINLLLMIDE